MMENKDHQLWSFQYYLPQKSWFNRFTQGSPGGIFENCEKYIDWFWHHHHQHNQLSSLELTGKQLSNSWRWVIFCINSWIQIYLDLCVKFAHSVCAFKPKFAHMCLHLSKVICYSNTLRYSFVWKFRRKSHSVKRYLWWFLQPHSSHPCTLLLVSCTLCTPGSSHGLDRILNQVNRW